MTVYTIFSTFVEKLLALYKDEQKGLSASPINKAFILLWQRPVQRAENKNCAYIWPNKVEYVELSCKQLPHNGFNIE